MKIKSNFVFDLDELEGFVLELEFEFELELEDEDEIDLDVNEILKKMLSGVFFLGGKKFG